MARRQPVLPLYKEAKKQGKRARFVADKLVLEEGQFVTITRITRHRVDQGIMPTYMTMCVATAAV